MTGMAIRAADGTVLVDMTINLPQTFGYVDTNAANGSMTINDPLPPGKKFFYIVVSLVPTNREKGKLPGVTINDTTKLLSWGYSYNTLGWGNFSANARIYYGYY